MSQWDMGGLVTGGVTDGWDADFTFAGTHRMNPGNPLGVAQVNERFNVTLPADFDAFYRKWDGGVLLFREFYPLLSVRDMLDVNELFTAIHRWDGRSPVRLIRFADLSDARELCFRLDETHGWQMVFKTGAHPDDYYFTNCEQARRSATIDPSFTAWLRRMVATDGWPLQLHGYCGDEMIPPTERVE